MEEREEQKDGGRKGGRIEGRKREKKGREAGTQRGKKKQELGREGKIAAEKKEENALQPTQGKVYYRVKREVERHFI